MYWKFYIYLSHRCKAYICNVFSTLRTLSVLDTWIAVQFKYLYLKAFQTLRRSVALGSNQF